MASACHAHWWEIQPANGPTSPGVCNLCGAEGVFENTLGIDSTDWIQRLGEANRRRAKERWRRKPEEESWSET